MASNLSLPGVRMSRAITPTLSSEALKGVVNEVAASSPIAAAAVAAAAAIFATTARHPLLSG